MLAGYLHRKSASSLTQSIAGIRQAVRVGALEMEGPKDLACHTCCRAEYGSTEDAHSQGQTSEPACYAPHCHSYSVRETADGMSDTL